MEGYLLRVLQVYDNGNVRFSIEPDGETWTIPKSILERDNLTEGDELKITVVIEEVYANSKTDH